MEVWEERECRNWPVWVGWVLDAVCFVWVVVNNRPAGTNKLLMGQPLFFEVVRSGSSTLGYAVLSGVSIERAALKTGGMYLEVQFSAVQCSANAKVL